jgi:4-hydroxy-2-oxoheptanedioate aldolase
MHTPENTFKRALKQKQAQIGLWLALADGYAAELCATSGFDWLLIDGEHAPNDLRSTLSCLQALAAYPAHAVVRLPQGDPHLIKQVMELGAQTLLIPMVETAQQAAQLVAAMRYPPQGTRGVGSAIGRSSRWQAYPRYLHEANEQACLLVQVETKTGLEQLPEILKVEGVDGIFIGPADLSASLGYLGQSDHPVVTQAIEAAIKQVIAAGKAAGILATGEALARRYLDLGASFVAVGVDTSLLAISARALAAKFKHTEAKDHA